MKTFSIMVLCLAFVPSAIWAQTTPPSPTQTVTPPQAAAPSDDQIVNAIKKSQSTRKAVEDALKAENDPDFALVVGIGSLISASGSTDYSNQSNVLHSNNLGRATPQFLTGVSFRSKIPNFGKFKGDELWQKRPWNGFVSVKFSPSSSQTLDGFVFGLSYSLTKYLNAQVGYSLTPVNEPSPGFRNTAALFVEAQQKLGQDLQFDPNAMLKNSHNAFDGFPVTDPTGKLIYTGNPLTVHYHGGIVLGVSIPVYFSSVFK